MKKSMLLPQRHNEMLPTHYEWLLQSRRDDAFVQASIRDRNHKARERLRATNEGTVEVAATATLADFVTASDGEWILL